MSDLKPKDSSSPDHDEIARINQESSDREELTGCFDQINCIVRAIVSGKELTKQLKELK